MSVTRFIFKLPIKNMDLIRKKNDNINPNLNDSRDSRYSRNRSYRNYRGYRGYRGYNIYIGY